MPARPAWFRDLPCILEKLERSSRSLLDRQAVEALFGVEERRARQLLRQFAGPEGLVPVGNALGVPRDRFCHHLRRFAQGEEVAQAEEEGRYAAEQREDLKSETPAQRFRILLGEPVGRPRLAQLPETITWRRTQPFGPARFEIWYDDGADLMEQMAKFLRAASAQKEEFYAGTEPAARPSQPTAESDGTA